MKLLPLLRKIRPRIQCLVSLPKVTWCRIWGNKIGKNCKIDITASLPYWKGLYISDDCFIGEKTIIAVGHECGYIQIGSGTAIGKRSTIGAFGDLFIGEDCLFSDDVHIADVEHIFGKGISPTKSGIRFKAPVFIGHKCFIGKNAVILPGTYLGDGCIVGANTTCVGYYPPNSVITGVIGKVKYEIS